MEHIRKIAISSAKQSAENMMEVNSDKLLNPNSLAEFLSFRLSTLSGKITAGGGKLYAEKFDLNGRELRVILSLGAFGSLAAKEISKFANMDKGVVSRGVNSLIKRDLVRGEATDSDGRKSILYLTKSGHSLFQRCFSFGQARMNAVVAILTSQERKILDRALLKLSNHLDELNEEGYSELR